MPVVPTPGKQAYSASSLTSFEVREALWGYQGPRQPLNSLSANMKAPPHAAKGRSAGCRPHNAPRSCMTAVALGAQLHASRPLSHFSPRVGLCFVPERARRTSALIGEMFFLLERFPVLDEAGGARARCACIPCSGLSFGLTSRRLSPPESRQRKTE